MFAIMIMLLLLLSFTTSLLSEISAHFSGTLQGRKKLKATAGRQQGGIRANKDLVWVPQNVRCHFGLAKDYLHTQMHKPGPASDTRIWSGLSSAKERSEME